MSLLYRVRRVLDSTALKNLYFPFIHSYLNYGNIEWVITQALKIVNNEFTDTREIMVKMEILNVYKLNIYQILNFMFQIKTNTAPCIFKTNLRRFSTNIQLDLERTVLSKVN